MLPDQTHSGAMALLGHSPTQAPQATQASEIT
jgi:hypothetical protein